MNRINYLKQQYMNHENWINHLSYHNHDSPYIYKLLFEQKPITYNYYRHFSFLYIKKLTGEEGIFGDFLEFIIDLKRRYPDAVEKIIN